MRNASLSNNCNYPSIGYSINNFQYVHATNPENMGRGLGVALGKILNTYDRPIGEPGPLDYFAHYTVTQVKSWGNTLRESSTYLFKRYAYFCGLPISRSLPISANPHLRTLSEFSWCEKKPIGNSFGAIYHDASGQRWMVKGGYIIRLFNEFIAGALYQSILNEETTPRIDLIVRDYDFDDMRSFDVLTASKFLNNFQALYKVIPFFSIQADDTPWGVVLADGNKIKNLHKVIYTYILLQEDSPNFGGLGIVNKNGELFFAKVDHNHAFEGTRSHYVEVEIAYEFYRIVLFNSDLGVTQGLRTKLKHAFNLDVLDEIAALDIESLTEIIEQKYKEIESYIQLNKEYTMNPGSGLSEYARALASPGRDVKHRINALRWRHRSFVALSRFLKDPGALDKLVSGFPDDEAHLKNFKEYRPVYTFDS